MLLAGYLKQKHFDEYIMEFVFHGRLRGVFRGVCS